MDSHNVGDNTAHIPCGVFIFPVFEAISIAESRQTIIYMREGEGQIKFARCIHYRIQCS